MRGMSQIEGDQCTRRAGKSTEYNLKNNEKEVLYGQCRRKKSDVPRQVGFTRPGG